MSVGGETRKMTVLVPLHKTPIGIALIDGGWRLTRPVIVFKQLPYWVIYTMLAPYKDAIEKTVTELIAARQIREQTVKVVGDVLEKTKRKIVREAGRNG